MDLHRIEGTPEWADVPSSKRNTWQIVAARTAGIVTIGNFFSVLGLLSIPLGLVLIRNDSFILAVIVLAMGRVCDLADGWFADKTGTKSPLGEKIDASFDKISTGIVIVGLILLGTISAPAMVFLIAPHAVIAVIALVAFIKGRPFHPSRAGKLSMAAIWATILVFIVAQPLQGTAEDGARLLAYGLLCLSVSLGLVALTGYMLEMYRRRRKV
ncbi:MAG: hypothetical protein JWP13_704 [Candidatus Saccharibacteria bacterium]|nr:hypothetical protein [Candidatus Saccharibacteria bacterium]